MPGLLRQGERQFPGLTLAGPLPSDPSHSRRQLPLTLAYRDALEAADGQAKEQLAIKLFGEADTAQQQTTNERKIEALLTAALGFNKETDFELGDLNRDGKTQFNGKPVPVRLPSATVYGVSNGVDQTQIRECWMGYDDKGRLAADSTLSLTRSSSKKERAIPAFSVLHANFICAATGYTSVAS